MRPKHTEVVMVLSVYDYIIYYVVIDTEKYISM